MQSFHLLWADDEIELLKPHILFLESKGYKLTTVNNGMDAIDQIKEQHFDLVFLDENMPGISGLDALKEIKELDKDLPVIMITKSEEEHIMEDAIGSKIADYLIKPVNPNQILLSIKRQLDNKRLVTQSVASRYQQEFRNIMMALMDHQDFDGWKKMYKKLVFYELEIQESNETGMEEVLETQKLEMNREFSKYVQSNYVDFIQYDNNEAPVMSHTLMRKEVVPQVSDDQPVFFVLIDNLRYDQWKFIQPIISTMFRVEREDLYLTNLPTTTQYCRNSIFAGLLPADIEKRFPNKWSNDEDEGGKNLYEEEFLNDLLKRLRRDDIKTSYTKVVHLNQGKDLIDDVPNLFDNDLNVIVYNFVDSLSHARTDNKVMRELAENEAAYRSLTKSWFEHSPLYETLKRISERKAKVIISTDHGSVKVTDPVKVVGDKKTTTNLRYKTGRNLSFNEKEVFHIKDPQKAGLPVQHLSSNYIFCRNSDFFVYPNNLNHYAKYYKDTIQHGGISLEEMVVPLIHLASR
ncbi:MAG: bifunctional response regulator/alkaline phosphatase family protein [Flavobacteriales bacterium]|nr:bifunctional response regulator/alkaline phosphatase family protein [Bacteroidota bacterium]MCB9239705.1 bifunctional response regulator/alkaline phosphatase family protein [Flavobacteriales bacterium]